MPHVNATQATKLLPRPTTALARGLGSPHLKVLVALCANLVNLRPRIGQPVGRCHDHPVRQIVAAKARQDLSRRKRGPSFEIKSKQARKQERKKADSQGLPRRVRHQESSIDDAKASQPARKQAGKACHERGPSTDNESAQSSKPCHQEGHQ